MKKIFILAVLSTLFSSHAVYSQNVGIGTNTPAFKLDVRGGTINTDSLYRIGGYPVLSVKGNANTFVGINTGSINSTGSHNTASGFAALYYNTTGIANTANGFASLYSNTTGTQNTATGYATLYYNTIGNDNTANGYNALGANTIGISNTATGMNALQGNSTGNYNNAYAREALFANTTGSFNSATGVAALYNNTTGTENIADGGYALLSNTTGISNTAIGYGSLYSTTASSNNTALGSRAGDSYNLGWNNTFIGANSDVSAAGIYNCTVIGESNVTSASNRVRLGNVYVNSIGGYAGWTELSDGRVKKNIQENVPGLAFISKLKPVTYTLDLNAIDRVIQIPVKKDNKGNVIAASQFEIDSRKQKEEIVYTGFIAQDVEKVSKEINYDFSGVDAAKNDKDLYGLRYAEFVVPLVKAVQEQQQQLNEIKKEMDLLKKQNKILIQLLNSKK